MAAISLQKLNKHYGAVFHAVKDVDLEIADKEFVALVGPSGCGKSTTLRMIAGLEDISSGDIRIGGKVVNHLPPRDRDVAMVFQNYALYQHLSVYDNLAFGLRNMTHKDRALAEMARVARPGGRVIVLEFSRPAKILEKPYDVFSFQVLPQLGKYVAKDEAAYRYLAESIRMHPDQETLKGMMEAAGLARVEYFNLAGGVVALHRGYKV